MMKTSLIRQAAVTRLALAARPAQASFRALSATQSLARPSRTPTSLYRPVSSLVRFYSSEAAPAQSSSESGSAYVTKFADLPRLGVHQRLVRSITEGMGYETMTEVQSATINAALAGKDVVAQAKTGTGKTLAFLVPIIQRIIAADPELADPRRAGAKARSDDIRAIIVSPTRELAEQIGAEAKRVVRGTGVIVQTAVGGTQKGMMLRKARIEGCHLLVATPGRLHDLLSDRTSGIDAPRLAALVLDEADRMLEVGFKSELEMITDLLPDRNDVPRQTLLYSATLPKNVVGIARQFINPTNFEFVQTVKSDEVPTHERVPQFIVPCRGFENFAPTLLEMIRRETKASLSNPDKPPFKAIVFLPTTAMVMLYTYIFRRLRYQDRTMPRIYDIHSKLTQHSRTLSANDFRDAESAILFASDVAARGMDFPNVSHVVQIHLPQDRDLYIHRIGRTGRAGKEGKAYLFASDVEIPAARDRLPGLPIQRSTEFASAAFDIHKNPSFPEEFETIREAASKASFEILRDTYNSMLGNAIRGVDKQDLVHEINSLAKYSWNMDEPPAVSRKLASQFGRGIRGLRIAEAPVMRSRDSYGRGGRTRTLPPRDGFEMMEELGKEERRPRGARPTPTF